MSTPIDPLLRGNRPAEVRGVPTSAGADGLDVDALFRTHRPRLLGLAAAITLDRHIAEEVVQDAFAGLHRHRATIDRPVGYLQRSVINLSVDVVRRRRRTSAVPPVPQTVVTGDVEIDDTWAAVARLPSRQRAVVALRFWEDMTVDAIAEVLDVPAGSVKSALHRAMKRLEEELG